MGCLVLMIVAGLIVGLTTTSAEGFGDWVWIIFGVCIVLGMISVFSSGSNSGYTNPFEGKAPINLPLYFECSEHGYEKAVHFYNHHNPPTCPTCENILSRTTRRL